MDISILPDELFLSILEFLPNRSLLHFSMTTRKARSLAHGLLQHREKEAKYTHLNLEDRYPPNKDFEHPVEVIQLIDSDPSIANYVREISFSGTSIDEDAEPEPVRDAVNAYLAQTNGLENHINTLTFLPPDTRRSWHNAVKLGIRDPSFFILFALCKKMTHLHLCDPDDGFMSFFLPVFQLLTRDTPASGSTPSLFPRLTSLRLSHWDTGGELFFNRLPILFLWPSVTSFDGFMIGKGGDEDWTWPAEYAALSSNIETVILEYSEMAPQDLLFMVRGMPKLRHLEYYNQDEWESGLGLDPQTGAREELDDVQSYAVFLRKIARPLFVERGLLINIKKDRGTASVIIRQATNGEEVLDDLGLDVDDSSGL